MITWSLCANVEGCYNLDPAGIRYAQLRIATFTFKTSGNMHTLQPMPIKKFVDIEDAFGVAMLSSAGEKSALLGVVLCVLMVRLQLLAGGVTVGV